VLKFFIITPSYNRRDFIEETICSVLNQSYPNFIYLVVDGASSDGTVDLLTQYATADSRFSFISEPDNGMYDAINKGLTVDDADIYAYLNTDDQYFPWTLKVVQDFLGKHPEIDIVYGDSMVITRDMQHPTFNIYPSFTSSWLRGGAIISQPTVFFRKKVRDLLCKFSIDVDIIADCEFWLRATQLNLKFRKIDEVLATEFNHAGTVRHTYEDKIAHEKELLRQKYPPTRLACCPFKQIYQRIKYFEKEILTIKFIKMARSKNSDLRGERWCHFFASYSVSTSFKAYWVNKIIRNARPVWEGLQRMETID